MKLMIFLSLLGQLHAFSQQSEQSAAFNRDNIINIMYRVNGHFLRNEWQRVDRNWIRGTYYTGLMTFYQVTGDSVLLRQARTWAAKHGWRTGTEWIHPANRMTCVQTYLELFFLEPDLNKISNAREVMDGQVKNHEPASGQGWDYVDALFVGSPAYIMMSEATGNPVYASYGHRMFRDVWNDLYDRDEHLFYRDEKAKNERSRNGMKVFWSRGNGWAFGAIPRILDHMPDSDTLHAWYLDLFRQMAGRLKSCQSADGFWRTNLADPDAYPDPESSGTAFFTYGLAWGMNNGFLDRETYLPVVESAWSALCNNVDENGKVCRGQGVARGPGKVDAGESHEFVAGAFLLAGSEVYKLLINPERN